MKMDAETGVMQLYAKEYQGLPEAMKKLGEKHEMHSLPRTSREMWPSSHLDLGFLVSRTARE